MPFALLDDGLHDHPKIVALLDEPDGLAAFGLWALCLAWAKEHTDPSRPERAGLLPTAVPRRLAGRPVSAYCDLLVTHSLWEQNGAGWHIHDFAFWQELEQWRKRRIAGALGAAARWHPEKPAESSQQELWQGHSDRNADGNSHLTSPHLTSLSPPPTPSPPPSKSTSKPSRSALARFAEFWAIYPRKVGKAAAEKAWAKAVTAATPADIIAAAERYRDKPGREARYTAHPTTWLNQGRWADEPDDDPGEQQ